MLEESFVNCFDELKVRSSLSFSHFTFDFSAGVCVIQLEAYNIWHIISIFGLLFFIKKLFQF